MASASFARDNDGNVRRRSRVENDALPAQPRTFLHSPFAIASAVNDANTEVHRRRYARECGAFRRRCLMTSLRSRTVVQRYVITVGSRAFFSEKGVILIQHQRDVRIECELGDGKQV